MSEPEAGGLVGWVVGASGAIAGGFAGVARWVRSIDNRMTVAESTLLSHRADIDAIETTQTARSRVLYETRDACRDNAKDIAVMGGEVKRNGVAISELKASHAQILQALAEILREVKK